ncbi:hypothetical protein [Catenovulum sediminis]|uniref:Uncharacterized protein n=1 Tax=Catenovulum sediminis TaxID=1740262 RepID=A0ABV1RHK8_9ALTE
MTKNKLIKSVLQSKSIFSNKETYFFLAPFGDILSGFFCEMTPRGAYVWKFVYPLFDISGQLHLSYSSRLAYPEDFIDYKDVDKSKLAQEFLFRIVGHICDAYQRKSLSGFLQLCESRSGLLNNEVIQASYGCALILDSQNELGLKYLEKAIPYLPEGYRASCLKVIHGLQGVPNAQQAIYELKADNLLRLKIKY